MWARSALRCKLWHLPHSNAGAAFLRLDVRLGGHHLFSFVLKVGEMLAGIGYIFSITCFYCVVVVALVRYSFRGRCLPSHRPSFVVDIRQPAVDFGDLIVVQKSVFEIIYIYRVRLRDPQMWSH